MNTQKPFTLEQIKKHFRAADACCLVCETEGAEVDPTSLHHGQTHVEILVEYITAVLTGEADTTPEDLAKFLYHDILGNL